MYKLIRFMANHSIAANLLMLFLLIAGGMSALTMPQRTFPEFSLDKISIRVAYPGASPAEIESAIIQRIEEVLEGIEEIQEYTATTTESSGSVILELRRGTRIADVLDKVKAAVDHITTFPVEAEPPVITELTNRRHVLDIILYGAASDKALKELAHKIKDDLISKPGISLLDISGTRKDEMSIEISQNTLRHYHLSLPQVAALIKQNSMDLPGGNLTTDTQRILLRVKGENYQPHDFGNLVVATTTQGAQIHLRDIATIRDDFADTHLHAFYNGKPAVFINVLRTGNEQVLDITQKIHHYLNQELQLPPTLHTAIWRNDANELKSRLHLLINSGIQGIVLVMLFLALFLNAQLAYWVSLGVLVTFVGAFFFMSHLGLVIDQMSLFGFIMAIGLVVDDAIVIAEHIYVLREQGKNAVTSCVRGTLRMAVPVFFSVLTTIIGFMPLLFLPGTLGKILFGIPAVVIIVLSVSLAESLFILPAHLKSITLDQQPRWLLTRVLAQLHQHCDRGLQWFIRVPLTRALTYTTQHAYNTISMAVVIVVLSATLVKQGYIKIAFFPQVEANYASAALELSENSALSVTQQRANDIVQHGKMAAQRIADEYDINISDVYSGIHISLGTKSTGANSPEGKQSNQQGQSHLAVVEFALPPAEQRRFSAKTFIQYWRQAAGDTAKAHKINFSASSVKVGEAIHIELFTSNTEMLKAATAQLKQTLASFPGVFDIHDDHEAEKPELHIELKPQAHQYGLSLHEVATQLRAAFLGAEALRLQRGRHEMVVYVRLPASERNSLHDLHNYHIRTQDGHFIPISEIATVNVIHSLSKIKRRNGQRVTTITADVDPQFITAAEVNQTLSRTALPQLSKKFAGLHYDFGGEQGRKAEVNPSLQRNFLLAMLAIYAIMAILFRSYSQPLLIMISIPMGVAGAVLGHAIMGLPLGLLSIFGIIGLSGVIINNSILTLDCYNQLKTHGSNTTTTIIQAATQRFRPILLTSLTTCLGVAPLLLERSTQAQYLIPMATSICFGIFLGSLFSTFLLPALLSLGLPKQASS